MSQYLIKYILSSKNISQDQAEEFAEEILIEVRANHLFPNEAVQLVKVIKKTKDIKILPQNRGKIES